LDDGNQRKFFCEEFFVGEFFDFFTALSLADKAGDFILEIRFHQIFVALIWNFEYRLTAHMPVESHTALVRAKAAEAECAVAQPLHLRGKGRYQQSARAASVRSWSNVKARELRVRGKPFLPLAAAAGKADYFILVDCDEVGFFTVIAGDRLGPFRYGFLRAGFTQARFKETRAHYARVCESPACGQYLADRLGVGGLRLAYTYRTGFRFHGRSIGAGPTDVNASGQKNLEKP
jgi:hypothetical protein